MMNAADGDKNDGVARLVSGKSYFGKAHKNAITVVNDLSMVPITMC